MAYHIGYLMENRERDYSSRLYEGVAEALKNEHLVLLSVPESGYVNTDENYTVLSKITDLLKLDVLIVPVGVLNVYLAKENRKAADLLEYLSNQNIVIAEDVVEGCRCVGKDNTTGMHDLMKSLIEEEGLTKICCISGPEKSHGAREREGVYFEEMKAHGLEVTDEMFDRGVFNGDCADVVEKMLDNNPDVEAIVSGNDQIAMTVYEVLKKRNKRPGYDVMVTGFDDVPAASLMEPPLNTVRQDAFELGYKAGMEALRLAEGKEQESFMNPSVYMKRFSRKTDVETERDYFRKLLLEQPFSPEKAANYIVSRSAILSEPTSVMKNRDALTEICEQAKGISEGKRFVYLLKFDELVPLFEGYSSFFGTEDFILHLSEYLQALLEFCDKAASVKISDYMTDLNTGCARYMHRVMVDSLNSTRQKLPSLLQVMRPALLYGGDANLALKKMFEVLDEIGLHKCSFLQFDMPIDCTDYQNAVFPSKIFLKAYHGSEGLVVHEDVGESMFINDLFLRMRKSDGQITSIMPVYADHMCYGLFMAETKGLLHGHFFINASQVIFSIVHLHARKREAELIRMLNQDNAVLAEKSNYDELSGLMNRRGFMSAAEEKMKLYPDRAATLFYFDLDDFKSINDTYGHDAGDHAIQEAADILRHTFREGDLVSRLGGDEFLAFVIHREESDAELIEERIHKTAEEFSKQRDYTIAFSCGHTTTLLSEASDMTKMMNEADKMLYEQKKTKKSRKRLDNPEE